MFLLSSTLSPYIFLEIWNLALSPICFIGVAYRRKVRMPEEKKKVRRKAQSVLQNTNLESFLQNKKFTLDFWQQIEKLTFFVPIFAAGNFCLP